MSFGLWSVIKRRNGCSQLSSPLLETPPSTSTTTSCQLELLADVLQRRSAPPTPHVKHHGKSRRADWMVRSPTTGSAHEHKRPDEIRADVFELILDFLSALVTTTQTQALMLTLPRKLLYICACRWLMPREEVGSRHQSS